MRCECILLHFLICEVNSIAKNFGCRQVSCKCSYLEIYNENITDLLSSSNAHLHIREDATRGTYVENLCEEEASSGLHLQHSESSNACKHHHVVF